MKIAILLSGRINNNAEQYENIIASLVQNHDVDFFISYPKNTDKSLVRWASSAYKPKVLFENPEDYYDVKNYIKYPETNPHNVMSMFLSRAYLYREFKKYCNQTDEKYNCIISTRMDLFYSNPIDYNAIIANLTESNIICIPLNEDHRNGINDQFCVGNMESIEKYINVYYSIKYFLETGIPLHPETLLRVYLQYIQMKIYRINYEYKLKRY